MGSRSFRRFVFGGVVLFAACGDDDLGGVERSEVTEGLPVGETGLESDSTTTLPDVAPSEQAPSTSGGGPGPDELDFEEPPDVVIHTGDGTFALSPHSFCYRFMCADGTIPPAAGPRDLGEGPEVFIEFPLPSWTFEALLVEVGEAGGRQLTVDLESQDDGRWRLGPAGHAGTYDVWLTGYGDGDAGYIFRWTFTEEGPFPLPTARMAILADHDGVVDSYGVELAIEGLAHTPATVTATISVTASNGERLTFDATPASFSTPEGMVYFDGPADQGLAAATLGPAPFTYEVVLILDGVSHVATAEWPADQLPDLQPNVALHFEPPLPAMS